MAAHILSKFIESALLPRQDASGCQDPNPQDTVTDRLNTLLNSSGPGYVLTLCPNQQYLIQAPLLFAAPNQEISTAGYPTGNSRAMLVVNGPVSNGTGHTTAVDGSCATCSGVILRNVQINGTRAGAPPTNGGANIEFGGPNSDQVIEYVRSFDPRSWSCLHIAEGSLNCNNATVQNNDIGPCGSDAFQEWADGISVSCSNSLVRNNMINNPTDGGIILFGAPGTHVENNTIWVETQTLLGGINMVDYDPYSGDYTSTIVTNNTIKGGFSTEAPQPGQTKGTNSQDAIIKIGIAIGPRTWFGDHYGNNVSTSGTVINNQFMGAFSYAIAMSSATNFTVENNVLVGNTSFIGAVGPNCSTGEVIPDQAPFIVDPSNVQSSTIQPDFQSVSNGDGLTCVLPPAGGDFWPFGSNPGANSSSTATGGHITTGQSAGIAIGVVAGVLVTALVVWFIRKRTLDRATFRNEFDDSKGFNSTRNESYAA